MKMKEKELILVVVVSVGAEFRLKIVGSSEINSPTNRIITQMLCLNPIP